ncbi:hypothetical protein [Bacillus subtilis]|uniref:Uncharacterized protein n=1 Tax=Bacillus subtilis TaxID=1423 RepID=A0A8I2B7C9_BACIU|nr:hypothetical protein [Bacillus subtilis]MBO3793051.1 hypothetical protein [Bacillus subtilis]
MGKKLIETTQAPPHYCDVAYLESSHMKSRRNLFQNKKSLDVWQWITLEIYWLI